MRSIPLAMIWEYWHRGKWVFPGAILTAIAVPGSVFGMLLYEGVLELNDSAVLNIHHIQVIIDGLIFGAAVIYAQGRPARLYALPVPTSTLVAWHLIPGMVAMLLMSVISTAALNGVLGSEWPLWGVALFMAVAFAATQSVMWLTEKSIWAVFAVSAVGAALGIWFRSRYGGPFSPPTHLWLSVSPGEIATMLTGAGLAWCAATVAIARDRCGEALTSPRFRAWFERICDPAPALGAPFRSPAQAHFWFEWRQKGVALPAAAVMGLAAGFGCWLIFSRNPQQLFNGVIGCGALLCACGLIIGMVMGNVGTNDVDFEMGHFLATRPMKSTEMAYLILKSGGLGVLMAWLIWGAAFLTVYLILLACQLAHAPVFPASVEWWFFPLTLVGPWVTLTLVTMCGLIGRPKLMIMLLTGGVSLWIGMLLYSKFGLSREGQAKLLQGGQITAGLACVGGTFWLFAVARRRLLIGSATALFAVTAWLLLGMLVVVDRWVHPARPLSEHLLVAGVLALAVAPLAGAPLALAGNRHR